MSNTKEKLQSIVNSPVSLHGFMKTLKNNISEACKVQVHYVKDSEPDYYDKNELTKKVNNLVRLHEQIEKSIILR